MRSPTRRSCCRRTGSRGFPSNSTPYTSTIVFLVRQGNPKHITRLGRPHTSRRFGDNSQPQNIGRRPLELSRGMDIRALTSWRQSRSGKNFRYAAVQERSGSRFGRARFDDDLRRARHRRCCDRLGERCPPCRQRPRTRSSFEIVRPPTSILAEPPVALVDGVVDQAWTRRVAQAYLEYLYSPQGQEIVATPLLPTASAICCQEICRAVSRDEAGDDRKVWRLEERPKEFFADGGVFDQIYQPSQ